MIGDRNAETIESLSAESGHLCWVHSGIDDWCRVATAYLDQGRRRRLQLVYLGDRWESELLADLLALPDRDDLLRSGQLQVRRRPDVGSDSEAPMCIPAMREAATAALEAGYAGLRVVGDASSACLTTRAVCDQIELEYLADALVRELPVSMLCGFDAAIIGEAAAAAMRLVHSSGRIPDGDQSA